MSGQVTVPLPARRQGRRGRAVGAGLALRAPGTAPAPTPDRIPRVARVLALAHHWQGLIRSGAVRNQADLARLVGVSRARVTQVLSLLCLAPDVQEELLFAMRGVRPAEAALRLLARKIDWREQRQWWPAR